MLRRRGGVVSVPSGWRPSHQRRPPAELRGRRRECDLLDRLLDAVRGGESRALVVRGEPGVGETALLDYLAEHASGCRVARVGGRVGDGARSLLDKEETSASTNLPLEDLLDGKAWIAFRYDGEDLEAEHGGPARLLVPHLDFMSMDIGTLEEDRTVGTEPELTEAAMTSSNLWTDGNALAGPLHDVFRVDVTTAIGRCTECGRTGPMAEVRVFDHAPGVVARCPVCDQVLLRLVRGPGRAWLDMRGLTYLQLPVPDAT